jgi:hypothetical protein
MPCDSIITQSVVLDKVGDRSLLRAAVESLGAANYLDTGIVSFDYQGSHYIIENGSLIVRGRPIVAAGVGKLADRIKQAYSKAVILKTAKLQGWKVKDLGNNRLQVMKARY